MTASIPRLQSALHFFLNRILICYGCSPIFELIHPSKWRITYLHAVILTCMPAVDSKPCTQFSQYLF
jgi:hypothetical protein